MAENEEWEILSDSSNTNCSELQPCLIVSTDTHCPTTINMECSETVTLKCTESVCLSDSYSSMPPLMESTSTLDVSNDEFLLEPDHDSIESCPDPIITIHEYIAAISLIQLRQTLPSKKNTKRIVPHTIPNHPMTRSFTKKLSESTLSDSTVKTRPMTRLYKKQLGL